MLTFTLEGEPQGKARPRVGRGGHVYTPDATRDFELRLRARALDCVGAERPVWSWQPVELTVIAVHERPRRRPASVIASDWHEGLVPRVGRPDADNVLKAVADALNGVAFTDDAQIVRAVVETYYAEVGGAPRLVVDVRPFNAARAAGATP